MNALTPIPTAAVGITLPADTTKSDWLGLCLGVGVVERWWYKTLCPILPHSSRKQHAVWGMVRTLPR
jgi:hypothetical protein